MINIKILLLVGQAHVGRSGLDGRYPTLRLQSSRKFRKLPDDSRYGTHVVGHQLHPEFTPDRVSSQ